VSRYRLSPVWRKPVGSAHPTINDRGVGGWIPDFAGKTIRNSRLYTFTA
jgi:hypothetical protein